MSKAAWWLVLPSTIGAPVTTTAPEILMSQLGLTQTQAEDFLSSLSPFGEGNAIRLALADPAGDEAFKKAVLETYEYYGPSASLSESHNSDKGKNSTNEQKSQNDKSKGQNSSNGNDNDPNNNAKVTTATAGTGAAVTNKGKVKDSDQSVDSKNVNKPNSNGASSSLPSLNGLCQKDALKALEKQGFKPKSGDVSQGGWQTFKHPDGSQVDINWGSGRTVRTAAPKYGQDGSRINKGQRLDSNGNEIPRNIPHDKHPAETINISK